MTQVLNGFAVITAIIAVGYLLARTKAVNSDTRAALTQVAFNVATPALLLGTLLKSDVHQVLTTAALTTVVSTFAICLLYALLVPFRRHDDIGRSTIGALCASYVNAANLGIPIATYVLGSAAYCVPVMIFQLVVVSPIAFVLLDASSPKGRIDWRRAVLTPFRNPITIAALVGLICSLANWRAPQFLTDTVDLIGAMAVPAILLAFGISLRGAPFPGRGGNIGQLAWITVLKLFGQPAIAWLFAAFVLHLRGVALLAAIVTAALPTAQNIFVYASHYRKGEDLARDSIMITTVAALPVIVALAAIFG